MTSGCGVPFAVNAAMLKNIVDISRIRYTNDARFKLLLRGITPRQECYTKALAERPNEQGEDGEADAIDYEAKIYAQLNSLVRRGVCPNLVQMVTHGVCTGAAFVERVVARSHAASSDAIYSASIGQMDAYLRRLVRAGRAHRKEPNPPVNLDPIAAAKWLFEPDDVVHAITTLVPVGFKSTLFQAVDEMPEVTLRSVLFQMLYTLYACNQAGIVHNDNHLGNWLVGELPAGHSHLTYALNDNTVVVLPNQTIIYLYDWDRGFSTSLGDNPLLATHPWYCKDIGQCNRLSPQHDNIVATCSVAMRRGLESKCKGSNTPNMSDMDAKFVEDSVPINTVCVKDLTDYPCMLSAEELSKLDGYTAGRLLWHPYFDVLRKPMAQATGRVWGLGNSIPNLYAASLPVNVLPLTSIRKRGLEIVRPSDVSESAVQPPTKQARMAKASARASSRTSSDDKTPSLQLVRQPLELTSDEELPADASEDLSSPTL